MAANTQDPMAVAWAVGADLAAHPMSYVIAGLAYLVLSLGAITAAIGVLGLGMAPGAIARREDVLMVGLGVAVVPYTAVILAFALVAYPLLSANLLSALDRQQRTGRPITFSSVFQGSPAPWRRVVGFSLLVQALVLGGMVFLYVPGIIAAAVGLFAFPIVVLEDVPAWEALRRAWRHVRQHAMWHVVVWLVGLAAYVLGLLVVLPVLLMWPISVSYQLAAYRLGYGSSGSAA